MPRPTPPSGQPPTAHRLANSEPGGARRPERRHLRDANLSDADLRDADLNERAS